MGERVVGARQVVDWSSPVYQEANPAGGGRQSVAAAGPAPAACATTAIARIKVNALTSRTLMVVSLSLEYPQAWP